jgi:queuine tRNA-ribosyltransferase
VSFQFILQRSDGSARTGILKTDHGVIETPVFVPVGTQGTVKTIEPRQLEEIGAQIILGNTYHLALRPGEEILKKAGGLHRFIGWRKPLLTDSGGFQIFSLTGLREITEEGVRFQSHLDGAVMFFSPERVVELQRAIGADIMMVLDECMPYPSEYEYAKNSIERSLRWAERCRRGLNESPSLYGYSQALFGIVQGSLFKDLREKSAAELTERDFDGYAIGGLAVGEPTEEMYAMTSFCTDRLPADKPRYLMGVGTPENLLESIERGCDMFDCVLPTRNARNGMAFTSRGRITLKNAVYKQDFSPLDDRCECYTCGNFSRAYLRYLFQSREILGMQLLTLHNLSFYMFLMRDSRRAIEEGRFKAWKLHTLSELQAESTDKSN